MTTRAVRAKLGLVNIGMARRTRRVQTGEFQFCVAGRTLQCLVLSFEWETRLTVIELRVATHLP